MREELDGIVKKYNLIERTFTSFWQAYDAYLEEEPTESREAGLCNRDSISAELYGYAFCVTKQLDFDCITVTIEFGLKEKHFRCGEYWCEYSLDGKEFDYYFVID